MMKKNKELKEEGNGKEVEEKEVEEREGKKQEKRNGKSKGREKTEEERREEKEEKKEENEKVAEEKKEEEKEKSIEDKKKELKEVLIENAKEYYKNALEAEKKEQYNSSVTLFFKAISSLCNLFILLKEDKIASSHSERFRILEVKYPSIYEIIDGDFPFYQDSYRTRLNKEVSSMLKEDVEKLFEILEIRM